MYYYHILSTFLRSSLSCSIKPFSLFLSFPCSFSLVRVLILLLLYPPQGLPAPELSTLLTGSGNEWYALSFHTVPGANEYQMFVRRQNQGENDYVRAWNAVIANDAAITVVHFNQISNVIPGNHNYQFGLRAVSASGQYSPIAWSNFFSHTKN